MTKASGIGKIDQITVQQHGGSDADGVFALNRRDQRLSGLGYTPDKMIGLTWTAVAAIRGRGKVRKIVACGEAVTICLEQDHTNFGSF